MTEPIITYGRYKRIAAVCRSIRTCLRNICDYLWFSAPAPAHLKPGSISGYKFRVSAPICGMILLLSLPPALPAQDQWPGTLQSRQTFYETGLRGIRILPGQWRPHYPWEQIAWVKPPWSSHDYVWMDFPEVVLTAGNRLFLSHINPPFPQVYPDLPRVPWQAIPDGLAFERLLPDGVAFGGNLRVRDAHTVALTLWVRNDSRTPLIDVKLQTCAFLRHTKEFAEFTRENKFVHVRDHGWLPFDRARALALETGRYRLGWRAGPQTADLPVMVTMARRNPAIPGAFPRLVAMTWDSDTYSLISNPNHPCMHADPALPDIPPGDTATIHGRLIFFEGTLEAFQARFFP